MNAQLASTAQLPANVHPVAGSDILYITINDLLTHRDALKAASELQIVEGYGQWELATLKEVASLVDHSRFSPAVNTDLHPGIKSTWYWLKDVDASSPSDYAWDVDFTCGSVYYGDRGDHARALAVCRPAPASQQ
ncbi:DUF1566 domain-containing protein [Dyella sp.]|uniref:Lcl C-terminal domain-containing protein n=1 Tax=Dyella sp. TaxID=1869338 RepID=UPI00283BAFA8|nr:DUF1566 domain-containing protein [Dyella sp.]MDR3445958.1 DUF1566 domain-containing protein [Dyella sp.]